VAKAGPVPKLGRGQLFGEFGGDSLRFLRGIVVVLGELLTMLHDVRIVRARSVQKIEPTHSGSDAVVIVEYSTETLSSTHRPRYRDDWAGPYKPVFEALMIALSVIVSHELVDRVLE
jgi:hypothetical protein